MNHLLEDNVHFVGKDCYEKPLKTDKTFLQQLIHQIENIIHNEINEDYYSNPNFHLSLEIKDDNTCLNLSMKYHNDFKLYPDDLILNSGYTIQEKLITLLTNSFQNYEHFYYDLSGYWGEYYPSITLSVASEKGMYWCPICGAGIEDSKYYYINNPLLDQEKVVSCTHCMSKEGFKTFFVENCVNKEFKTDNPIKISNDVAINIINPNDRTHRLLTFEFSVIARNENISFRSLDLSTNNPKMYVITHNRIPVGYVYWNDYYNKERCLRQLFIREKYRNKGYATILVKNTIKLESNCSKFIIESPNDISELILSNLGYIDEKGNCVGCSYCFGM